MLEDAPFELPKRWAWCKLGEICEILDAKRKPITKKDRKPGPYPYYGATCIQDYVAGYIFDESLVLLGEDGAKWGKGDKSAFCVEGKIWVNNHAHVLRPLKVIDNIFLSHALTILDLQPYITGTTVPKLNQERMCQIHIPLPPLTEQKRIVARIGELFRIADSLGEAADRLEAAAERLDKKILDLAIRGKLVPQDPKDEPVSELLKGIAATSHKSPCKNHETPLEPPFAIPELWEWVRLGNVSDIIRGTGIKRNETSESGVQCVRYGEIYTDYGYSFSCSVSHVPLAVAEKCHEATFGDVLCTLTGENEVEIAKATAYLGKDRLVIGGDLAKITNHPYDPMLLVYFLFSPFMISQKAAICTGGMIVHMGKSALSNLLIPLPPLAEQKRIVSKIEELRKATQALTM